MNAWSHLPNAHHIDRIIESLKTHPDIWTEDSDAAQHFVRNAAWLEARAAARDAARVVARSEVLEAAWSAIAALIAWDDSVKFLDMSSSELEVWARLSNDPRAIMLLPAVRAFERIKELETA